MIQLFKAFFLKYFSIFVWWTCWHPHPILIIPYSLGIMMLRTLNLHNLRMLPQWFQLLCTHPNSLRSWFSKTLKSTLPQNAFRQVFFSIYLYVKKICKKKKPSIVTLSWPQWSICSKVWINTTRKCFHASFSFSGWLIFQRNFLKTFFSIHLYVKMWTCPLLVTPFNFRG